MFYGSISFAFKQSTCSASSSLQYSRCQALHHTLLYALQAFTATAYVFCAALQSVPAAGTHSIVFVQFQTVQDTKPTGLDWPAEPGDGSYIYAKIAIR